MEISGPLLRTNLSRPFFACTPVRKAGKPLTFCLLCKPTQYRPPTLYDPCGRPPPCTKHDRHALPDARAFTGEAMGMAIDSIRSETDQESSHCRDESSQKNSSSLATAIMGVHQLAPAIAGGGLFAAPGGSEGAAAATTVDQPVGISIGILSGDGGGGEGDGGIAHENDGLQEEGVNQLEQDRKMRRRQVERTAARLSRVRVKRLHRDAIH